MLADKITPGTDSETIENKEARNVLDGYALYEAAFIRNLSFPYEIDFDPLLPPTGQVRAALIQEVERLRDTFDALADLALTEGVFQVTQGNYDRAGAMLNALSKGQPMPEPEVVRTPRSGTAVHHKISLHLDTQVESPWPGRVPQHPEP